MRTYKREMKVIRRVLRQRRTVAMSQILDGLKRQGRFEQFCAYDGPETPSGRWNRLMQGDPTLMVFFHGLAEGYVSDPAMRAAFEKWVAIVAAMDG